MTLRKVATSGMNGVGGGTGRFASLEELAQRKQSRKGELGCEKRGRRASIVAAVRM